MSVVTPLRTAVDALSRNPVLFLGGLVYAALLLPQGALQLAGVPFAPLLLQMVTFVVTPFVVAGVVGMARDALDGDTSFDALTATGRARYLDLLLATLLEFGIQVAFGVVFVVLALVLTVLSGAGGAAALVGGAVILILVGVYIAVLFAIQFYPVIVVVDDAGAVESVTQSVSFVRSNVFDTLGYTLVTVVLGFLASLPMLGAAAYRVLMNGPSGGSTPGPIGGGMSGGMGGGSGAGMSPGDILATPSGGLGLSTPEIAALALVSVVATTLFFAFRYTYATAFYQRNARSVEERVLGDDG